VSAPAPLTVHRDATALAGERHRGGEGPLLVLLHAGVADRRAWRAVAERLAAEGMDVVAYDRRGFGETRTEQGDFRHVDDLLAVLDAAGGGPAWLVGNSMGGALALEAAVEAPERVAGLVLIAPAVPGAPEPADEEYDPASLAVWEAIQAADEAGDVDRTNALEVRLWLDGAQGAEGRVGGAARELALDMNRIALTSGLPEDAGDGGVDVWNRLGEVRAPATVAWGDLDVPQAIELCAALAERLPDSRGTRVLAGTGHLPMLEAPDAVAALVRDAVAA
jgi:pimeloyl-ACP methyl ester carboxylesterase